MGKLAVRGQRRVRARLRSVARQAPRAGHELLAALAPQLGTGRGPEILEARQITPDEVDAQRQRIAALDAELARMDDRRARDCARYGDLVRRSVWIVGGDGWAYDIG